MERVLTFPAAELVTAPTLEPINLQDVKEALRINSSQMDSRILRLIKAARQQAEEQYNIAFLPQTWANYYRTFGNFRLSKWPLAATPNVAITYTKSDATTGTVDTADYAVEARVRPSYVRLKYQKTWPVEVLETNNPVKVQFAAGWANADAVPANLKEALILIVERWLNNPSDIILTERGVASMTPLPYGSAIVLANYEVVY